MDAIEKDNTNSMTMDKTNMANKFIDRKKLIPKSQDFRLLRKEAIQMALEHSGELWTDFNDHDPGVTILEQVCYAITELSYQAELDPQFWLFGHQQNSKGADFFLLPGGDSEDGSPFEVPVSSITEMPGYYSIQKTFPDNYGLRASLPVQKDEKQQQLHLRTYLTLLESLLLDFHVRLHNFSGMLMVENNGDEVKLGEKFANAFNVLVPKGVTVNNIADTYEKGGFTLNNQIAFQEYLLQRYGELYDEATKTLLAQIWEDEENSDSFKTKWLEVLKKLVKGYEDYAGKDKNQFFTSGKNDEELHKLKSDSVGVLKKLEILLSPINATGEGVETYLLAQLQGEKLQIAVVVDVVISVGHVDPQTAEATVAIELVEDVEPQASEAADAVEEELGEGTGPQTVEAAAEEKLLKNKRAKIAALIKQLFPFYAIPKYFFLDAAGWVVAENASFTEVFERADKDTLNQASFETWFAPAENEEE